MTNDRFLKDLDRENIIRLRAEVHVVADKLRRYLMDVYREEFAQSVLDGEPMRLRSDPEQINDLAMKAASLAFQGREYAALTDG